MCGEFFENDLPEEDMPDLLEQQALNAAWETTMRDEIVEQALRWWATRHERHRSAAEVDEVTVALDKLVGKLAEARQ